MIIAFIASWDEPCGVVARAGGSLYLLRGMYMSSRPFNLPLYVGQFMTYASPGAGKECGVLFGVDETICGFRVEYGGAHVHWGLQPDLVVYGKLVGGGAIKIT